MAIDATGTEQAAAAVPTPFSTSVHGIDMEVADLERALTAVVADLGQARGQRGGDGHRRHGGERRTVAGGQP